MNELITIPTYGENEVIIYDKISNIECAVKHTSKYKQKSAPYKINISKNKKLVEQIELVKDVHKRFITPIETIIKNKYIEQKGTRHRFTVKGYKISKAYVSYLLQNKENVQPHFNVKIREIKQKYRIRNFFRDVMGTSEYTQEFKNGEYPGTELRLSQTTMKIKKTIVVKDFKIYIDNQYYEHEIIFKTDIKIRRMIKKTINEYEWYVNTLNNMFSLTNKNNDNDWDKHLTTETQKIMSMDFEKELAKLQTLSKQQRRNIDE